MLKLQVGSGVGCTNKLITKMSGQNVPRSSQFLRFFRFCGTTEQSSIIWTVTSCAVLHGNPNSLYQYSIIISLLAVFCFHSGVLSVLKFLFIASSDILSSFSWTIPWLAFRAEGYLADVCRVFTGKHMNQKWCLARGKAENLNRARTA